VHSRFSESSGANCQSGGFPFLPCKKIPETFADASSNFYFFDIFPDKGRRHEQIHANPESGEQILPENLPEYRCL